jgi:dipeptidyl aminopeptidase/acylaminoacyl peptidase
MILRAFAIITLAVSLVGLAGCRQRSRPNQGAEAVGPVATKPQAVIFPDFGPARTIRLGIQFQEATLQRDGVPMRVWYYQPAKATGKLAVVLVPPAGSTLFVGMDLGEGDRQEHYPYVEAGFAVASFEIDGHVPNLQRATDAALVRGAREFKAAHAGLDNAKTALEFLLAKVPQLDPQRVYIAGHSSAATLALLTAEYEPRIKACAAYAPVTDVPARLAQVIPSLEGPMPGFAEFIRFSSPSTHVEQLRCPVFLFHAQDDKNVPPSQSTDFAERLKRTNPQVTLVTNARGGHYESMIREGIPQGIRWFQQLR